MLTGCLVTLDAMGCQRDIAQKILDGEADYTISLKGNQGSLHADVQSALGASAQELADEAGQSLKTANKGHGREEVRRFFNINAPAELKAKHGWPGLASIGLVKSTRIVDGKATYEDRYYIASYSADVTKFANAVRSHWAIENSLHWVLDVSYSDDDSRVRKGNGAENLSTIRRIAINMLKREPKKESLSGKQILCAHNPTYLLKVLTS